MQCGRTFGCAVSKFLTSGLLCARRLSAITRISLSTLLVGDDVGEESKELSRGIPRSSLTKHRARLGVEGGTGAMCRAGNIQTRATQRAGGTTATPDPLNPAPGWPSFHRRFIQ